MEGESPTFLSYFPKFRITMEDMCTFMEPSASSQYPVGNYMFKVNNRNTRTRCEIYSKLTIKTPERRQTLDIFYTLF